MTLMPPFFRIGTLFSSSLVFLILVFSLLSCIEKDGVSEVSHSSAVSQVDQASVRIDPIALSSEVDFLKKGERVKIIKKSLDRAKIGKKLDYWYLIQKENGIEGWVYGTSLSLSFKSASAIQKEEMERIEEEMVGKWWELRPDGTTGNLKIYFWPDGKYRHGDNRSAMVEGEYRIDLNESQVILSKGSGVGDRLNYVQAGGDLILQTQHEGKVYEFRRGTQDPNEEEAGMNLTAEEEKEKLKEDSRKKESLSSDEADEKNTGN